VIDSGDPAETAGTPRWSTPHKSAVGERYPVIINGYDRIPGVRIQQITAGPRFVFAQGDDATVYGTPTVYVNGIARASGNVSYGWSVVRYIDGQGTSVVVVDFNSTAYVWQDNDAVHVTCTRSDQSLNPVDAMRFVLERFSPLGIAGVNAQAFAEAAAKWPATLSVPRICINAASGGNDGDAIAWAEGGLLASFPMLSMVWERGGYGCVLTDFRSDPVAEFVVGQPPLLERLSLVQETPKGGLYNEFVLRYAYNVVDDIYEGVITRNRENSALCDLSERMVGQRHMDPLESPYIADADLAQYVMDWMVEHWSLPSYVVEYEGFASAFLLHRRGDTVLITDPDFGWVRERATIDGLTYRRGKCTITLRVWQRAMDLGGSSLSVGGI
jgi:hypothetical protein